MRRTLTLLLLIVLGAVGYAQRAFVHDLWTAMYPEDPARQTALARCAQDDTLFNRFSSAARAACYERYLHAEVVPSLIPAAAMPAAAAHAPAPSPASPSSAPEHYVPHPPTLKTNH